MSPSGWRFDDFVFEARPFRLLRAGQPVTLQPQPARALELLVSRAGEVVRRDELRSHLWSDGTHVEYGQAINFTVRKIREALGDEAAVPRFVETVPRVGYRFVASVETLDSDAPRPVSAAPAIKTRVPPRRWPVPFALSVAGLVAWLAVVRFDERDRRSLDEIVPRVNSTEIAKLAVLPLTASESEAPSAQLAAVMTEELLTRFAQEFAPSLGVIALRSAQVYGGAARGSEELGELLDADYLVRAHVAVSDPRLRVTARLLRVEDQVHVWAKAYEIDVAALPDWYEEVSREVAAHLGLSRIASVTEPSPSIVRPAYEAYLRGRYLIGRDDTPSIERGLETLQGAVAAAPGFARAHAAVARAHYRLAGRSAFADHMSLSAEAARQALRLDDRLVDAHLCLAKVLLYFEHDWPAAGQAFERAVSSSPASAEVVHPYGLYLASVGRFDEAVSWVRRAVDLDPATIYASSDLAYVYFLARRYGEAIAQVREHLALYPTSLGNISLLSKSLWAVGDDEGAVDQYNLAVEILAQPTLLPAETYTEVILHVIDHVRSLDRETQRWHAVDVASGYLTLGEMDRAFDELRSACEAPRSWAVTFLAVDPRFDALRADPRWRTELAGCLAPVEL